MESEREEKRIPTWFPVLGFFTLKDDILHGKYSGSEKDISRAQNYSVYHALAAGFIGATILNYVING